MGKKELGQGQNVLGQNRLGRVEYMNRLDQVEI